MEASVTRGDLIAIGVDGDGRIWKGHFGMAAEYRLFDRAGELMEKRGNPHGVGAAKRKDHSDPTLIMDLLPECTTYIARRMGKQSQQRLIELGVETITTDEPDPLLALAAYLDAS